MRPNKIAVVGAGTAGLPEAAVQASAPGTDGSPPPRVVVLQRRSPENEWKVDAINAGKSPLGGIEPGLDDLVAAAVGRGTLSASTDLHECRDAQAVLVCVGTDRQGLLPEYGGLMEALGGVAAALKQRPGLTRPLVMIESTVAPSTMQTVIGPYIERQGLVDGRDLMLGHSPRHVRRGRAVDDLRGQTRLVSGLRAETPVTAASFYRRFLTRGRILVTSSLTAEVAHTLASAWEDVRHAFASEIARHCERLDVDYLTLRDQVNDVLRWPDAMRPSDAMFGGDALPIPAGGVGGPCLPRDGILLWWRALEAGHLSRNSIILAARAVNDASPAATVRLARLALGAVSGRRVAVLGAAAGADTDETRHSPALVLANLLRDSGAEVVVHDPYVRPTDASLARFGLAERFTDNLEAALAGHPVVFIATPHRLYRDLIGRFRSPSSGITAVVDACHLFQAGEVDGSVAYAALGQGRRAPERRLVRAAVSMYRAVARGVANEVDALVRFLNARYATDAFTRVDVEEVRRLVATSADATVLDRPGRLDPVEPYDGFVSGLAQLALDAEAARLPDPRRAPLEPVPPGLWFGNEDAVVADETPWPLTPRP